ncbi:AAA-domain-containing protein [Hypomontagnella monticulosa]|nr:AAA-domain-containing protein [Hypomontagnella monticulosa]
MIAQDSIDDEDGWETENDSEPSLNSIDLHSWFINNCIKTFEELNTSAIPLVIDASPIDQDSASAPHLQELAYYMINNGVYNSFFDILLPLNDIQKQSHSDQKQPRSFAHDAMAVRMPLCHQGQRFLEVVTQHFARDIGADLLMLCLEDIKGIAMYSNSMYWMSGDVAPGSHLSGQDGMKLLFKRFLRALQEKRDPSKEATVDKRPIIVLLPEVIDNFYGQGSLVLVQIRDAVKDLRNKGQDIAIIAIDVRDDQLFTKPKRWPEHDDDFLTNLGFNPLRPVQVIMPSKNETQMALMAKDFAATTVRSNIRRIQGKIQNPNNPRFVGLLEPYSDWKLNEDSFAYSRLRNPYFTDRELDIIASALSNTNLDVSNIEMAFARLHSVHTWRLAENIGQGGKWASFPKTTRKLLQDIEESESYEADFLSCIVSPEDVQQSWSDIEIDDDIKASIKQLVCLASSDPKSQYGILSKSRVRGALLYGPPGTGKTQLARVLAHEFKATMIHVSAADIDSKWIGEAEKLIKALYSLASMLAPAIVFIDEADSLFKNRDKEAHGSDRGRINQFLTEQDGLGTSEKAPFLLLSTNRPDDLDQAVLRRVPERMYIGLPSITARENMLNMFLRGEKLDAQLQPQHLAELTAGFSGSDINTLCVKAALACQEELDKAGKSGEIRVITKEHFGAAFKKVSSTVSSDAVYRIRRFAEKFDPTAVTKMDKSDATMDSNYSSIYL